MWTHTEVHRRSDPEPAAKLASLLALAAAASLASALEAGRAPVTVQEKVLPAQTVLPTCAESRRNVPVRFGAAAGGREEGGGTSTHKRSSLGGTALCNREPISERSHACSSNQRAGGAGLMTITRQRVKPINRSADVSNVICNHSSQVDSLVINPNS